MGKPSVEKPWMKYWGDNLPDLKDAECTAFDFLVKRCKDLSFTALSYFDRKITVKELVDNIKQTAKLYKKLGVKKGDIVTICSVMTPETIYSFYALDYLGAMANMTDPRTSSHGLKEYIAEVHSKIVVVLDIAYRKIQKATKDSTEVENVLVVSPADSLPPVKKFAYKLTTKDENQYDSNVLFWHDVFDSVKDDPEPEGDPYYEGRGLLIVHTGGTTGKSKGVILGDRALNSLSLQAGVRRFDGPQEKFLNIMPPFIAYGFGYGVHGPLTWQSEVILIPKFEPRDFGKLIKKYKPEHTAGVPLHYQILADDPRNKRIDLSKCKTFGAGGDAISVPAERAVNKFLLEHGSKYKLCKGYGMTEASACSAACIEDINREGSVGIPNCFTTVSIFEPGTDNELTYGEKGEVCFNTPLMMNGYYNNEEETKNVIRKHSDGSLWVHTGDIGKMDEDGFLYIVNRIKRVIIRHDGFKIFPSMIEEVVDDVNGVDSSCAVAIKDKDHKQGNLPCVFVKVSSGVTDKEALEAAIREACADKLPEYVQPVVYEFVEDLPYTAISKVDYINLTEQAKSIKY